MPGPSGLHPTTKKQNEPGTQEPTETATEAKDIASTRPRHSADADEEATRAEAGWPAIGLAQATSDLRRRICIEYVLKPMLSNNQLGMDFATTVRFWQHAENPIPCRQLNDIHTAIVWRDVIILQRSNSLDDAFMFRWKHRENWMALKTMAILRKKGHWTCKKIKVYDTRPLRTSGTEENKRNRSSVVHRHLAQLLTVFGATKEVKLPECPLFWQQAGVNNLREFTTTMSSTPCLRGIPNIEWTPNAGWVIANQLPLVMRRTETSRYQTGHRTAWGTSSAPHDCTFAAYTTSEDAPQRGQGFLWHFPPTPASIEQPTLQLFTWSFESVHEQLTEEGIPQHFENVHVTLRNAQPGTRTTSATIRRIHQALQSFFFLKELTITIQIADIDEEMWTEEGGEPVAAYMRAMLKAMEMSLIETVEDQLQGRERPYRTRIVLMSYMYSQITSSNVVDHTSTAVKRALETFAQRNGYQDTVEETAHRNCLKRLKLSPVRITEQATIEADVEIGKISWRTAPYEETPAGRNIVDTYRREAIEAIEDHMLRDLQGDA